MNNAEQHGFTSELAQSLERALQNRVFERIGDKMRRTIIEILFALKDQQ